MKRPMTGFVLTTRLRLGVLIICGWAGSAAMADTPEASAPAPGSVTEQAQKATTTGHQNELICTLQSQTGSHIKRKTCKTRAQVEAEHDAAQQLMKDLRNQPQQARPD